MGTGASKIDKLGSTQFQGRVGENVKAYAKATQKLARELAQQLDDDAARAEREMRRLKGHPLLLGINVRIRAKLVAREFRKAKEKALAISAEAVKFNGQYRKEFLVKDADRKNKRRWTGDVNP